MVAELVEVKTDYKSGVRSECAQNIFLKKDTHIY